MLRSVVSNVGFPKDINKHDANINTVN
jgi:hypothetical protein